MSDALQFTHGIQMDKILCSLICLIYVIIYVVSTVVTGIFFFFREVVFDLKTLTSPMLQHLKTEPIPKILIY